MAEESIIKKHYDLRKEDVEAYVRGLLQKIKTERNKEKPDTEKIKRHVNSVEMFFDLVKTEELKQEAQEVIAT